MRGKYSIKTYDRHTGKSRFLYVDAKSPEDALQIVKDMGAMYSGKPSLMELLPDQNRNNGEQTRPFKEPLNNNQQKHTLKREKSKRRKFVLYLLALFFFIGMFGAIRDGMLEDLRQTNELESQRSEPWNRAQSARKLDVPRRMSSTNEWYEGGTLHRKTVRDWRMASAKNKLATAADWCAAILKTEEEQKQLGMEGLRLRASQLIICIDTAVQAESVDSVQVSEIAAGCIVLLEAQGW